MTRIPALGAAAAIGLLLPSAALAQTAYPTTDLNMRAGPGTQFPVVTTIPDGGSVNLHGCLNSYEWCDVSWRGRRGWVYAEYLDYPQQGGQRVIIGESGTSIGLPVISFSFGSYWDRHYRDEPWYSDRQRWRSVWRGDDDWRDRRRGDRAGRDERWREGRGDDRDWRDDARREGRRDGREERRGEWRRDDDRDRGQARRERDQDDRQMRGDRGERDRGQARRERDDDGRQMRGDRGERDRGEMTGQSDPRNRGDRGAGRGGQQQQREFQRSGQPGQSSGSVGGGSGQQPQDE